jgi:hypothetical protein
MTPLDISINSFFTQAGGTDFIGLLFAIPVIFAIVYSIVRPFNV